MHRSRAISAIQFFGNIHAHFLVITPVHKDKTILNIMQDHIVVRVIVDYKTLVPIEIAQMIGFGFKRLTFCKNCRPIGTIVGVQIGLAQTVLIVYIAGYFETGFEAIFDEDNGLKLKR